MKLGMHTPHVIPEVLTKWNILLLHSLADIAFLSPAIIEFYYFIHACAWAKFWICYPQ
jgi:hypothetical protein